MPPHADGSVGVRGIAVCNCRPRSEALGRSWCVVVRSFGGASDVIVGRVLECLEILLNGIKSRERLFIYFRDVFMF